MEQAKSNFPLKENPIIDLVKIDSDGKGCFSLDIKMSGLKGFDIRIMQQALLKTYRLVKKMDEELPEEKRWMSMLFRWESMDLLQQKMQEEITKILDQGYVCDDTNLPSDFPQYEYQLVRIR